MISLLQFPQIVVNAALVSTLLVKAVAAFSFASLFVTVAKRIFESRFFYLSVVIVNAALVTTLSGRVWASIVTVREAPSSKIIGVFITYPSLKPGWKVYY